MNGDSVLVINAGSSSLKFALFRVAADDGPQAVVRGKLDDLGRWPRLTAQDGAGNVLVEREHAPAEVRTAEDAIRIASAWLRERFEEVSPAVVGHRVVHGGTEYSRPVLIDVAMIDTLERLVPLAPLHQPQQVAAIRAVHAARPELPQVACFDTAFHRGHPPLADLYALPYAYFEAGVRRYGFHGLSYEYIASVLPRIAPAIASGRVIAAHLGNGASLCALRAGIPLDTTMGFSPLDGIPMGTRPGAIDPGVLLYLAGQRGMTPAGLERLLYRESGLLGLSGISNDMRVLLESDEPRARLAVDYFVHHVAKAIGGLAAVLGGLDGLVFTAGMGENSAEIRARILAACAWLGARVDADANRRGGPCISAADSAVSAWVVPTDEELMVARHALAALSA